MPLLICMGSSLRSTVYRTVITRAPKTVDRRPSGSREVGQCGFVSQHRPAVDGDVASDMALTAEDGVLDGGIAADAAVGPDDGVANRGVLFNLCLAADHRVRADAGAGLDEDALVDEAGSLDRRAFFETHVRGDDRA